MLALFAIRAIWSWFMIHQGFRALSDDDYSRVVIAQTFAEHPSLDPSKTSWLPFPFWLYGTFMLGFGKSLTAARCLAFFIGLLSSAGVWQAGRWLGLSRGTSAFASIITCFIPYSVWLGVATTPDVFAATLMLLGCCSLTRRHASIRICGAVAVVIAALSRYEAWPVAVIWSVFVFRDAIRTVRLIDVILAVLVLFPPLLWIVHGAEYHHDALFFVTRVVRYRRALGLAQPSGVSWLTVTPLHLFSDAPVLWALLVLAMGRAVFRKTRMIARRWRRPLLGALGVLAFLCVGDWRNTSATHHAGRSLLLVWYLVALIAAFLTRNECRRLATKMRLSMAFAALSATAVASAALQPQLESREALCPRVEETTIGAIAAQSIEQGERLAIDTPDFGYFAVQAAFARPSSVYIKDDHMRHIRPSVQLEPKNVAAAERMALMHADVRWVVAPLSRIESYPNMAEVRYRGPKLFLAKVW